ncbi:unnamed protein product [Dibothriocephalus latus]|uniref:Uncharacterized protein n=1 Tax=Dibothriocephalus latus TaxID=60516 RepID=A0A3P7LI54_DIBLA|nr:unnamed protein product [Dibothriocephalus latus]
MYAPYVSQPPPAAAVPSGTCLPPAGPLHYDEGFSFTITQLATQISRVFRNPSLDIPGKDAILSSLTSLQAELASGRLSASVQVLLRNLFSFIQQNDYERANETINALSSNHEMEPVIVGTLTQHFPSTQFLFGSSGKRRGSSVQQISTAFASVVSFQSGQPSEPRGPPLR